MISSGKPKKDHFTELYISSATDNKNFWQNVKLLISSNIKSHGILNLVKKDNLIDNEEKTAKICNKYLVNIVQKIGIMIQKSNTKPTKLHLDEVNMAIIKYKKHSSINTIKNRMVEQNNPKFSFDFICCKEIVKAIDKSSNKKASQNPDITVKNIKENKDLMSHFLHHNFNCYALPLPLLN